jgi:hypothetical protein
MSVARGMKGGYVSPEGYNKHVGATAVHTPCFVEGERDMVRRTDEASWS